MELEVLSQGDINSLIANDKKTDTSRKSEMQKMGKIIQSKLHALNNTEIYETCNIPCKLNT